MDDLLAAWAAASEIAHPFLSPEFLASERDNIPTLYLPNPVCRVLVREGDFPDDAATSDHRLIELLLTPND